ENGTSASLASSVAASSRSPVLVASRCRYWRPPMASRSRAGATRRRIDLRCGQETMAEHRLDLTNVRAVLEAIACRGVKQRVRAVMEASGTHRRLTIFEIDELTTPACGRFWERMTGPDHRRFHLVHMGDQKCPALLRDRHDTLVAPLAADEHRAVL